MCGISGFNWQDENLIQKTTACLAHRGPDASGVFTSEGVSLGHNRLSIIDLSAHANQPMISSDENLVIVFNGEIYNFEDLKKELSDYPYKTHGDTEVILAGYKKWGKEVVKKLNGIFVFAIWDKTNKELFLARDYIGVKPLYYSWDGEKFMFGSEMKAVLAHDIPRKLNIEAFNYYMRVLYTPAPLTMVEGVSKLLPGHMMMLKDKDLFIERFTPDAEKEMPHSYSEAIEILKEKVEASVKRQLVSDVPVGLYLSGGIDSSVILSAMTKYQTKVKTFSVGFDLGEGEEREKFNVDFNLARETAKFFNVEHHEYLMNAHDVVENFEKMIHHNDDPISNPTSLALFFLAKQAKKEVTVVLSGNGGDELFGGYERYRLALLSSYYKKLPKITRKFANLFPEIKKLDDSNETDTFARFMFEKDPNISRILSDKVFQKDVYIKEWFYDHYLSDARGALPEKMMETDQKSWLPDQALILADKMSMSSGIEERVPFLDNELIFFARSLPLSYKVTLSETKKILKDAFKRVLPPILFKQPKRGFQAPGAKWLRQEEVTIMARDILSKEYYKGTENLFNWEKLQTMFEDHLSKKEYNLTILWTVMTFQAWAKRFEIQYE